MENEKEDKWPKLTPETAFAALCVSMAVFFLVIVLYVIPSLIDRYVSAFESPQSTVPRKGAR